MAAEGLRKASDADPAPETKARRRPARRRWRPSVVLIVLAALCHVMGAFWSHRIHAGPAFAADLEVPQGDLRAVAAAVIDHLVLRELHYDFAPVIEQRVGGPKWESMLNALDQVNHIHPWLVMNDRRSAEIAPVPLAQQGFMPLRAHYQQPTETTQILQN